MPKESQVEITTDANILNADISDQLYRKCLIDCGWEEYAQEVNAYRVIDCR